MAGQETSRDAPAHTSGARKGEEHAISGSEPGRHERGTSHANRPHGIRTARDSTGINPEAREPIDPSMPHMPPA
jgi:hypothetical protein